FQNEIVYSNLRSILAFARGLQFLTRFHQRPRINVDREIKVWNRAETFDQPLRNDFAHTRKLKTCALAGLNGGRGFRLRFRGGALSACSNSLRRCANIGFSYAPVWSCAFHSGKINTEFSCYPPCNRRRFYTRFFRFLFSRLGLLLRRL